MYMVDFGHYKEGGPSVAVWLRSWLVDPGFDTVVLADIPVLALVPVQVEARCWFGFAGFACSSAVRGSQAFCPPAI